MAGEQKSRPNVLIFSKNVVNGVRPRSQVDFVESEYVQVWTVSNVRMPRGMPLSEGEFERIAGRPIGSFDLNFIYVGYEEPRYPIVFSGLKRLAAANTVPVVSSGISARGHDLVMEVLRVAGFGSSRVLYPEADDINGSELMGKIRKEILETGDFAGYGIGKP